MTTTATEWGVEMTAPLRNGDTITKVFNWQTKEEADADAAYRATLPFVNSSRVVSREVTTTAWEAIE